MADQSARPATAGDQTLDVSNVYSISLKPQLVPVALEAVHAGFPSVAQDYFSGEFSFDEHVIVHPNSTFIVRVAGDSMIGAGIFDNDLLIVDRSLTPTDGDVVIAILNDELTVKRLRCQGQQTYLHAENPAYPDFHPLEGEELVVWGVVTGNYHWQRADTSTHIEGRPAPKVTYPQPGASSNHTLAGTPNSSRSAGQPTGNRKPGFHSSPDSPYPSAEWGHHV
ncbi:hypothetical protein KIMH_05780 [Bombiscardovia apis]|uniref:Peptidase S24/S26A/S26B/S26C domain-containing protein n=1 Tax=Bombiscardovia apis TaxID=2932182 RepID=A0ABM8BC24_9BIFI|nr:S24 family peptidase [Bombiscardovia apis]BDR54467.1 hypothetical protein KIMH_05780 [Bombiscardovia apis]